MAIKRRAGRKGKKINYLKLTFGLILFFIGLFLVLSNFLAGLNILVDLIGWLLIYLGVVFHFIIIGDKPFLKSREYLKKIKNYFWISLILFLAIGVFGFLFPYFFEEQILNLIKELIEKTEGMGILDLIKFIMFNNVKSGFYAMVFGLFFGLIPIGIVLINGYILGFVANKTVSAEGIFILWRLLPHGIFEIPAVMISIALGLRLGMFLFIYRGREQGKEFLRWFRDSLRVFVFIVVPLLIVAAVIESGLMFLVG